MSCQHCKKEAEVFKVKDPLDEGSAGVLCAECKHSFELELLFLESVFSFKLKEISLLSMEDYAVCRPSEYYKILGQYNTARVKVGVRYFGYSYYF